MAQRKIVTIVGPGRLGSAVARALDDAGYRIGELIVRKRTTAARRLARETCSRLTEISSATLDADVIWLCVSDDVIALVARALAARNVWKGKIVLHSSGALTSRELDSLRARGASAASAHPMMTFATRSAVDLRGVGLALEGDRRAVNFAKRVARDLGMFAFEIAPERKPLYHVLGSFASPLFVALLQVAEEVARGAGIDQARAHRIITPILEQTIRNYRARGASAAFTGPVARGDAATLARHLKALEAFPFAERIYKDLTEIAVKKLPAANRVALRKLLRES